MINHLHQLKKDCHIRYPKTKNGLFYHKYSQGLRELVQSNCYALESFWNVLVFLLKNPTHFDSEYENKSTNDFLAESQELQITTLESVVGILKSLLTVAYWFLYKVLRVLIRYEVLPKPNNEYVALLLLYSKVVLHRFWTIILQLDILVFLMMKSYFGDSYFQYSTKYEQENKKFMSKRGIIKVGK